MIRIVAAMAAATFVAASSALAQDRLEILFSSALVINGPTVSPDGRLFTAAQPLAPGMTPQVVEVLSGLLSGSTSLGMV